MKTFSSLFVAFILISSASSSQTTNNDLVGAWRLISQISTSSGTSFKNDSSTIYQTKYITPSRFVFTVYDPQLLSKSRWQKAIGWTILGTGLPVTVISGVLISNLTEDDWNESAGRVFFVGSLVYTLTSIPLLIAGRRNKKRALSVSLIQNKTPVAVVNAISFKMQAGFSLKLSIN